jgi:hypothetical protein
VVVRHWFEINLDDASMQHGSRIELRALAAQPRRGSESAAQLITADRPLWRADLFDRLADEPEASRPRTTIQSSRGTSPAHGCGTRN